MESISEYQMTHNVECDTIHLIKVIWCSHEQCSRIFFWRWRQKWISSSEKNAFYCARKRALWQEDSPGIFLSNLVMDQIIEHVKRPAPGFWLRVEKIKMKMKIKTINNDLYEFMLTIYLRFIIIETDTFHSSSKAFYW